MSKSLASFISVYRQTIEEALGELLPISLHINVGQLNCALRYAVFPGGKRIRPMLTLLGGMIVGSSEQKIIPAACAIEFLHTSSLILDDMPGMDDACIRRGRATLHLVYGEGVAMLAALALLNQAYALLVRAARENGADRAVEQLITEATRCVGVDGMIGGQAADIETRNDSDIHEILTTRNLKTAALMRLTMTAGALSCSACENDIAALAQFGECVGIAYQIYDDLLDLSGKIEEAGKSVGQDARHFRPTFISELGPEKSRHLATSLIEQAKAAVTDRFGDSPEAKLLLDAADNIATKGGAEVRKCGSNEEVSFHSWL
jgi:geranylgeranyl diphosphate synthase, type II